MSTPLPRNLLLSGIAIGFVLLIHRADGAIIYSGPLNLTGGQIFFDLQNTVPASSVQNAAHDFELLQETTTDAFNNTMNDSVIFDIGSVSVGIAANVIADGSPGNLVAYVAHFTAGQAIGSGAQFDSAPYFNSFGVTASPNGPQGNGAGAWFNGTRGFVGLQLNISGQIYYGWLDVMTNNFTNGAPGAFTIFGYAYNNTPNTPIAAGVIPEPSSLMLCAAGAIALALLRKRKR
jgi:hypothetical protein